MASDEQLGPGIVPFVTTGYKIAGDQINESVREKGLP